MFWDCTGIDFLKAVGNQKENKRVNYVLNNLMFEVIKIIFLKTFYYDMVRTLIIIVSQFGFLSNLLPRLLQFFVVFFA